MQPIVQWLEGLGLGQYGEAFVQAAIDLAVLPDLTEADLEKLGVVLGHRKKLLRAIAALSPPAGSRQPGIPAPAPITPEAERRQITVMFCDLVGSTALSARLDPEDLRAVIAGYHRSCAEAIGRAGGFVAKYMGDGVLAYFGYPEAHEDDAERAVRAGLDLIAAVHGIEAGPPLQTRIGIATGVVVVGEVIGQGAAQEQAVVGETPNLAARLQALAEPDTVVVAPSTRRLLGGLFDYRELGPVALKGLADKLPAFQVLGPSQVESRFEARQERGVIPLVGRDEELDLLLRRWAQARAGRGRVVLISAEPGVGKSRLAEALAERIAAEPHIRLRYFWSPHYQDSALYPVIAQMERAAGFAREDAPEARVIKLEALLAQSSATEEETALIAGLLSLAPGERHRLPEMSPQKRKEKMLQALLVQSERLSARQPVLMVFEDVHWIDPTSLELLTLAVERKSMPLLLLATFRPEFQPPWTGQPHVTTLALTRLDRRDTAAMVANIAGNAALLPEIVREIAERTDGVPLFVEELTKAVLESGAQGAAALSAAPHPALSVPATLHASLMARLDRLGPAAKDVAQKGAVIGREFGHDLLASIADLPEPQLREALDRLTTSGLLFVRGTPPQSTYLFKHALVQDAAYGTLLRSRRQQLHARIAATLEEHFPEIVTAQPALLAWHCELAGLTEKAIAYLLVAGQRTLARAAMAEAMAHLQKGLGLLAGLPESASRQEQELALQIALGQALIATQGYSTPKVGETFARARKLCDQLNQPPQFVPVLYGQFLNHLVRGELTQARHDAAQLLELGETRGDAAVTLIGCMSSGVTCYWLGEFATGRAHLDRGLPLYDPGQSTRYAALAADDPHCMMQIYSSRTLFSLGYLERACVQRDQALKEARPHAHTLGFVLAHSCLGEWGPSTDMLPRAEESVILGAERGFPVWWASGSMFKGWCLAALGRPSEGIALLQQGLSVWRAIGAMMDLPMYLMLLADAYGKAREPAKGLEQLDEAARIVDQTQARCVEAEMHRVRGDLLIAMGEHGAAEQEFHRALTVARGQNAKTWELRAATSLARLWRDQGKRADAHELLAPVYAWFTEGFDAPDLIEAKALLAELAGR